MPRAWTEAIERELGRLSVLREEIAALAAKAAVPAPAPDPIDPAPLIEAAIAPIRERASQAVASAEAALAAARTAVAAAQEAASVPRQSAPEQVLIVFRALARILAVRILLFLSVAGSFALAVMAMGQQSWLALTLVGVFSALTIGPLAWLEVSQRAQARAPEPG